MMKSPSVIAPGQDRAAADDDHDHADDADDRPWRTPPIAETPVIDCAMLRNSRCTPLREDQLFALLGRVGLDDADAAEGLVEPAGDLGVDLAALAEERPQRA